MGAQPRGNVKKALSSFSAKKGPRIQRVDSSDSEPDSPRSSTSSPKEKKGKVEDEKKGKVEEEKKEVSMEATPSKPSLQATPSTTKFTPVSICDRTKSKLASFAASDPVSLQIHVLVIKI